MADQIATKEPPVGKGLQAGALGLWGNITIGLASTAPAYSLAATLGYVVLAVGDKAPAMFIVAFIPMLLVALAYRDLNRAAPDCGTVFTWGTKAFGPVVGWLGGWGLAVSGIIVLANVAEIAAIYLLLFLGQDELAENIFVKVGLGVVFIALMTWISYRGIVLSERIQIVLVSFQFLVLILLSVFALARVFNGTAGPQAVSPELSWFSPFGLTTSEIAAGVILCIFIYWGWDSCLAVTEETKDGATQAVDPLRHALQGVDVQSGIGFVHDGQLGIQNCHLEDLVALFLTAGKTLIHGAVDETLVHFHELQLCAHQFQKVHRVEIRLASMLANGIQGRLEEVGVVHAGNLNRVLEGHEDTFAGTLFRRHLEQILPLVENLAFSDLVAFAAGQHLRQRALARAVGPHDGMHFTCVDLQVNALQNVFAPIPACRFLISNIVSSFLRNGFSWS